MLLNSLRRQASTLCSRDGGSIGADGILVLQKTLSTDIYSHSLHIINQDGSLADNCGNGLRCAALSIYKEINEGHSSEEIPLALELRVKNRTFVCQFMEKNNYSLPMVSVNMGKFSLNEENDWHEAAKARLIELSKESSLPFLKDHFSTYEIGNKHIVVQSDNLKHADLLSFAPSLQDSESWDGMNVHLMSEKDPDNNDQARAKKILGAKISQVVEAFIWERGVGETQACGSGACAMASHVLNSGFLNRDEWVEVRMPGGSLYIKEDHNLHETSLCGPAEFVFKGEIEI